MPLHKNSLHFDSPVNYILIFDNKVEKELNIELKFTVHGDKIVIQPIGFLGKKFKVVDDMLKEHGYHRDKNREFGWHWYKILIGKVTENA